MKLHFLEQEWLIRDLTAAKGSSRTLAWFLVNGKGGEDPPHSHINVNTPNIPFKRREKQKILHPSEGFIISVLDLDRYGGLCREIRWIWAPSQSDLSPPEHPELPGGSQWLFYVENHFMYDLYDHNSRMKGRDSSERQQFHSTRLPAITKAAMSKPGRVPASKLTLKEASTPKTTRKPTAS